MSKKRRFQLGGKSHRCPGSKILRRDRADQSDQSQRHQKSAHLQYIGSIRIFNAPVNDRCHDQRHKKLKGCLQHFKKRGKNCFLFIIFQVNQQFPHNDKPHSFSAYRHRQQSRI